VEAALASHPAVAAAVVASRDDQSHGKRLIAYFIPRPSTSVAAEELRSALEEKLPLYMVPGEFVELTEIPLTPNGKIDRRRLPEVSEGLGSLRRAFVAPRTPLEIHLAELWQSLLQVERVGITDNFFTLGGHSLVAIQMIGHLRQELQVPVIVAALFENPTIESLALELMGTLLEQETKADPGEPDGAERP
jgi:hypothetical protein